MLLFLVGSILFQSDLIASLNHHFDRELTVAISERIPFAQFDQNGTPTGLDVSIISNFAKKLNFHVNYVTVNASLNAVFTNETNLSQFAAQTVLKYVNRLISLSTSAFQITNFAFF